MRRFAPEFALIVAVLVLNRGNLQAAQMYTPPPRVNAAAAEWQINAQVVVLDGVPYYPTAGSVFFNGNVMRRVGAYGGVPLYEDTSVAPFSMIFVPVAGNLMRRYERRDDITPQPLSAPVVAPVVAPEWIVPQAAAPTRVIGDTLGSIPGAQSNRGIWVQYNGARWYSAGAAVPYAPERFTPIGAYHGFPVYRDNDDIHDEIFIVSVGGGPLTPYRRGR
jgi:hypothetical protein